jgi:hypothetical protein
MKAMMLEPLLRDATIKAIDGVAKKVGDVESMADRKVTKLLTQWSAMDRSEKEHVAGIAVATMTTAVTAIVALRRAAKAPVKMAAKKIVKSAARKIL